LGLVVYNLINFFTFKDFLRRFGFLKIARRDYYECGFRPQTQRPIKVPLQFLLICIFFLLYDIELIFLFPYVSGLLFCGAFDFFLLCFFFLCFLLSLIVDYNRHALY
jgi:NADH:ubiquinone oxidoreductase subunit 3 (subunit A)